MDAKRSEKKKLRGLKRSQTNLKIVRSSLDGATTDKNKTKQQREKMTMMMMGYTCFSVRKVSPVRDRRQLHFGPRRGKT